MPTNIPPPNAHAARDHLRGVRFATFSAGASNEFILAVQGSAERWALGCVNPDFSLSRDNLDRMTVKMFTVYSRCGGFKNLPPPVVMTAERSTAHAQGHVHVDVVQLFAILPTLDRCCPGEGSTQTRRRSTELGKRVDPRLREIVPRGQREPGGGIHAT